MNKDYLNEISLPLDIKKSLVMHMLEQLKLELGARNYSQKTIKNYLLINRKFLEFIKKKPKQVTREDIKRYFYYLRYTRRLKAASIRLTWNALRFYYDLMWKKGFFNSIPLPKKDEQIPVVLTKDEIFSMIKITKNLKHKLILMFLYSAGLRLEELLRLRGGDLDFREKTGIVRKGKGRKDRHFILSEKLVFSLKSFLTGKKENDKIFGVTKRTVQQVIKTAARKAGIKKKVTPHTLRHSFATHLLESGVDIRYIQRLLGHASLKTTQVYTNVSTAKIKAIKNPLDSL